MKGVRCRGGWTINQKQQSEKLRVCVLLARQTGKNEPRRTQTFAPASSFL